MPHLWVRAEERANERRVGITPKGVQALLAAGFQVTVEDSATRIIPAQEYRDAGATTAQAGTWRDAPHDAIIFGLKELPGDTGPLVHRHILFGHAFKGQPSGPDLLRRFREGGGALYDLEYLVDDTGRRVSAFGFWAGYVGAALSILAWAAAQGGSKMQAVTDWDHKEALILDVTEALARIGHRRPTAIIIGALGRTGTGASAFCEAMGVAPTGWDMAETAKGGPFPEILTHDIFLNCILASPGVPVFVPDNARSEPRRLSVIGDIACDPDSAYSPIKVYDRVTTWSDPVLRIADDPVLDVMAIDNLPSLLPLESSQDFADELLPHLLGLDDMASGVWGRANETFRAALAEL
ncbi:saccharopine dehydrogenase [Hasllibacter sp. MH4015]|uniref:saccharopine dehydrogenase n=1 Tax=Hasllibacter sp. MH4015 TaxID=2854029 RepID=UPI001CD55602|nr:saccharopine dehydrogenase [Hasllibacter sp. MH4015]